MVTLLTDFLGSHDAVPVLTCACLSFGSHGSFSRGSSCLAFGFLSCKFGLPLHSFLNERLLLLSYLLRCANFEVFQKQVGVLPTCVNVILAKPLILPNLGDGFLEVLE